MPTCLLEHDDLRLEIDPNLGAAITRLDLRSPAGNSARSWTPLLRPSPAPPRRFDQTACFLMLPWVGRLRAGRFPFQGATRQLRITSADGLHAIHGDAHSRPWTITGRSPGSARLTLDASAFHDRNWPWPYRASVHYELRAATLILELGLTNTSGESFPAGAGFHPCFERRLWAEGPADSCIVQVPAIGRYPLLDLAACGPAAADSLSSALAAGTTLDSPTDDAFLLGPGDVTLTWPKSRVRLTIDRDPALRHAQCYAPHTGGAPAPCVCVEPMSMTTNGFNLHADGVPDTGVRILQPGEHATFRIALRIERLAD